MQHLIDLLEQFDLLIVFIYVLLDQIGLPIPAIQRCLSSARCRKGHYSFTNTL